MFAAAAASVVRRGFTHHQCPSSFVRGCGFCTTVNGGGGSSSRGAAGVPWLLLSSPDNPESRHLYRLTKDDKSGRNKIEAHRELSLPQISGYDFIGSSHGLLLTRPINYQQTEIIAIDPLTGEQPLRLPSCDPLLRRRAGVSSDEQVKYLFDGAKAILSPSRDTVAMLSPSLYSTACFARLHHGDNTPSSWTLLPISFRGERTGVHDLIFHKGRLHVVNCKGDLAIYGADDDGGGGKGDFSSATTSVVLSSSDIIDVELYASNEFGVRMCLAPSPDGDDLFLLVRLNCCAFSSERTSSFRVFKLHNNENNNMNNGADDGCGGRWVEVDNLGDVAMVVGPNRAMSLSATDFPVLTSNSIYFTDDAGDRGAHYEWSDTGVFHLEDGTLEFFGDRHYPAPIWLETLAAAASC